MVLDDDEINNLIIRKVIEDIAPDVAIIDFQNALKALDFLKKESNTIGLLFLDIGLLEMDAWEFLEKLAGIKPDLNVIIITVSLKEEDYQKAKNYAQVKHYIVKPLNKVKLQQVMGVYQN